MAFTDTKRSYCNRPIEFAKRRRRGAMLRKFTRPRQLNSFGQEYGSVFSIALGRVSRRQARLRSGGNALESHNTGILLHEMPPPSERRESSRRGAIAEIHVAKNTRRDRYHCIPVHVIGMGHTIQESIQMHMSFRRLTSTQGHSAQHDLRPNERKALPLGIDSQ